MTSTPSATTAGAHRAIRTSGKPHSCAECRRLKLRCDRVFPCESCRKRNVAALCPNGSLPPRPRLLAEDAVKLSKTIAELTNRCRQLEDALRTLQAKHSNELHPLLDMPLLTTPQTDHFASPIEGSNHEDQEEVDSVQDTLGTLTIDCFGNSNFLGRTAGMHMLLQSDDAEISDVLPIEIQNITSTSLPTRVIFSNLAGRKAMVTEQLWKYLPPSEKAWSLCEIYFDYAAWLVHPVARTHFITEIFGPIYRRRNEEDNPNPPQPDLHELGLLFMVFSLATLLDLTLPPNNVQAEFYHQLARAGLSCEPILVEPTVAAIQTLTLMSFYHWLGNRKNSEQIAWGIMGLTVNLSQNVGLHRDSAAWKLLDSKIVERQRLLFWELYALELTEALNFGRPPSLSLGTIDCKMPADVTQFAFSNDDLDPPFHSTKYRYFSVYLSPVIEAILGAKATPYSTILALDRRVRDQDVAPLIEFEKKAPGDSFVDLTGQSLGVTMQKFMIVAWPHLTLLYLHRGYFVRALTQHQPPQSLLENRFAPSVLAIFRTSCVIIAMLQTLESVNGALAKRFWLYWCHGLAAAIVVGSIVAKAPESPLAQPALDQVNAAYALFERAAAEHPEPGDRAAKALAVVTRLRFRAHQAFSRYHHSSKHGAGSIPTDMSDSSELESHDEALHIFGGQTRIVSGRAAAAAAASSSGGNNAAHSPASCNSPEMFTRTSPQSSQGSGPRGFTPETLDKAHPSLLADLRTTKETEQLSPLPQPQSLYHSLPVGYGDPSPSYQSSSPQTKYRQQITPSSMPPSNIGSAQQLQVPQPPVLNTWNGATQTPGPGYGPSMVSTTNSTSGYVPAPSDTQAAFGMLGGDPDWDNHWHSLMNQLGMYAPDPNAPYAPQKMER